MPFEAHIARGKPTDYRTREAWLAKFFPFLTLALFCTLVLSSLTGSSLALLAISGGNPSAPLVKTSETSHSTWAGRFREIRSDEWAVITSLAMGQKNHRPSFPVINQNVGIEGQNMLVVGMSGVPIKHVTALVKPATWGFFLFSTSAALSWYWYFPFFSCLLALFFLFNHISPETGPGNAGLALLFCLSPYAAGWSNWPLYATFFPAAMTLVFMQMLAQQSLPGLWLQSVLLGLLTAGFFFVLYPPWQIALATFFLALNIGYVLDNKDRIRPKKPFFLALALAVLIFGFLVWAWWSDAHEAISAIRATVYPGHRAVLHGADTPPQLLLFGYSNLVTLPALKDSAFNESEFSSFFYLFPGVFFLLFRKKLNKDNKRWTALLILAFITIFLLYATTRFPPWVAQLLLWNHVPVHRGQLALGLACIFAVVISLKTSGDSKQTPSLRLTLGISLSAALLAVVGMTSIPEPFFPQRTWLFTIFVAAAGGLMCFWMVREQFSRYILSNLVIYFCSAWFFNPIAKAPNNVEIADGAQKFLSSAQAVNSLGEQRILVVNADIKKSMAFVAAGWPVVNATFYYPQRTFWEKIGLPEDEWEIANRYQHLLVTTKNSTSSNYFDLQKITIDSLRLDLDPSHFNFSRTGASVIADGKMDVALKTNGSLLFLGQQDGWSWYAVRREDVS